MKPLQRSIPLLLWSFLLTGVVSGLRAQDDESEEISSQPWNLSLRARAKTAELKRGIDLSGNQGTLGFGLTAAHESGWSGSVSTTRGMETGTGLSTAFGLGYEGSFTEALTWSVDFAHTQYGSDSLNALATLGNSLSLGLDVDLDAFAFAFSAEQYFGSSSATYFSADISTMLEYGEVSVIPSITVSFMSQTVDISRIAKLKQQQKKQSGSTTKSLSGISGIDLDAIVTYPLGGGFSLSATPALTYSPQADISVKSFTASIGVGIRYSVDF